MYLLSHFFNLHKYLKTPGLFFQIYTPNLQEVILNKVKLKHIVKGNQTISEYMIYIKTRTDQLALLGKPIDTEDLIDKILNGLDDDYKSIVDNIHGRDTTISFDEIHEKLINKELSLK